MNQSSPPALAIAGWISRRPEVALLIAGASFLFLTYLIVFIVGGGGSFSRYAADAAVNSGTAATLASGIYLVMHSLLLGRSLLLQAIAHVGLGFLFAIIWYASVITVFGWLTGSLDAVFEIKPFDPGEIRWQVFQGMVLYAAIAASIVALDAHNERNAALAVVAAARIEPTSAPLLPSRIFVRIGDELQAVELDEVIAIHGSDDYSEVVTSTGRHLARKSLSSLERELPAERFLRVHRSHIVNLDQLMRAEPAGNGRLTLHLSSGDAIVASRAGSRSLRDRAV